MIAVTSRRACARSAERWAPAFAGGANKLVVCWNAMQAIAAPLLLVLALLSLPAAAAQAQSVNLTKTAVSEQQLLQQSRTIRGLGSIPDAKSYTLEQPAGRDWRHFHEVTLRWIGGIAILGMLAVLVFFYLSRGMVRIEAGRSGYTIVRFSWFERFVHWMTAVCFVVLALSGLNITFPIAAPAFDKTGILHRLFGMGKIRA